MTYEHAHDARGDSKALAECLAKAIRQNERLPICTAPISLAIFRPDAKISWGASAYWVDVPPEPTLTLRVNGEMDTRVSLKRGAVDMTADASPDRSVRQKTEESEGESATP